MLERLVGKTVAAVDDRDTYVCRPFAPGQIADALLGETISGAFRRGKFLCAETENGPTLGLHLGMAGRFLIDAAPHERWDRFAIEFTDGTRFALRDKRRLGRAVLNPDHSHLGPDAETVSRAVFRRRVGAGNAPIKARLLDQGAIAGVGNLLADEVLWQSRISPRRRSGSLSVEELDELRRQLRRAIRSAHAKGGVHTGVFARARKRVGRCPRDGTELSPAQIGGRTTIWCPECQR